MLGSAKISFWRVMRRRRPCQVHYSPLLHSSGPPCLAHLRWLGALICLVAIFAPSFFLVFGSLPFWESLRRQRRSQAALLGVNAAVVGLLLAALYQPIWRSSIHHVEDLLFAAMAFIALQFFKVSPLWVVIGSALIGGLIGYLA